MILPDRLSLDARRDRFRRICDSLIRAPHTQGQAGVGTLSEKRLHAAIKTYLCEDTDFHEVGFPDRRFVADVMVDREIYEVQTGNFLPLKSKIEYYLAKTDCTVTVVHPLAQTCWISYLDPATGELSPRRRSPRSEKPSDLFAKLYPLLPYLSNPRFRLRLLLIEEQRIRLKNKTIRVGRKRTARIERVPLALCDEICLYTPADYLQFLPKEKLPLPFTAKDYAKATGIRGLDTYTALRALETLSLIVPAGMVGRSRGYTFREMLKS